MAFKPIPIAKQIISLLKVRRLGPGPHAELFSYDSTSGLYVVGDLPLEKATQNVMGKGILNRHVHEVVAAVRRNAPLVAPEEINDPRQRVIVFRNGVLDLSTKGLEKHRDKLLYTVGVPHRFVAPPNDGNSSGGLFDKFMDEVLPRDHHLLVKQMLGYLLIPSTKYRKFFVLLGTGANGKSTLIRVIEEMLGRNNVSHQSLHQLAENRFAFAELYGKLANTYADLDPTDVRNAGLLKQIVSGDSLQYERKFKDPFNAPVTARLIFSANTMPVIKDESEALSDRLILIEFPNRFEGRKQDRDLAAKLTDKAEIERVIAQWAIPGLYSLLTEGEFAVPKRSVVLHRNYRQKVDPFFDFVQGSIERNPSGSVGKWALNETYRDWAWEQSIEPLSQREFNRRIAEHFKLDEDDKRLPGTRDRAWHGIRLRESQIAQKDPGSDSIQAVENNGQSQESQEENTTKKKMRIM